MAKDEREIREELSDISDMTWSVAKRIAAMERPDFRTPENVQVCIDALNKLRQQLERLKVPLLLKE
jgi:hypothetical protein